MPTYNVWIEEVITTLYQVEACSSDEAEEIAQARFLQDDRRGYQGVDVHEREVTAEEVSK
jgi:hypothetical protein